MTEHFTYDEAVALARRTTMGDQLWMNDTAEITAVRDLCNAAVSAKLAEWGRQEPIGQVVDARDGAFKCEFSGHLAVGTKLYTRPLPAQPEMSAGLMEAAQNAIACFAAADCEGLVEALAETTDTRLKDLVERRLQYAPEYLVSALSRAQAAQQKDEV